MRTQSITGDQLAATAEEREAMATWGWSLAGLRALRASHEASLAREAACAEDHARRVEESDAVDRRRCEEILAGPGRASAIDAARATAKHYDRLYRERWREYGHSRGMPLTGPLSPRESSERTDAENLLAALHRETEAA